MSWIIDIERNRLKLGLKTHAMPFFERFQTPHDVLRFLEEPRSRQDKMVMPMYDAMASCYGAMVAAILGLPEKSADLTERTLVAGRKSPAKEHFQDVRARLQALLHRR